MKKKLITSFVVFILIAGVVVVSGCSGNKDNNNSAGNTQGITEPSEGNKSISDSEEQSSGKLKGAAPDFSIKLLNGDTVKLSDYKGKVVFLNFWATWCGPCVKEMPAIQKLSENFSDKVVVLAVNVGENESKVSQFIEKNKYTFNVGLDEKGEVSSKYPTEGIPYTVIIDANGNVFHESVGASADMYPVYEKQLKAALGE